MGIRGRIAGGAVLSLLLLAVAGCGDDSSSGAAGETKPERLYPRVHGPSREFLIPGGDNIVQFFGQEASPAEREAASRVIHSWMKARVAKDWAADCKHLSHIYARSLMRDARQVSGGKAQTCPEALAFFGADASGTSGNTLTGPIDSLRVRGRRAYAQWHGPEEDWILPLRKENGIWGVESASPLARTK
jgi:hypothetical protein